jgi:hypothetical protein
MSVYGQAPVTWIAEVPITWVINGRRVQGLIAIGMPELVEPALYPTASIVGDERVVFNVRGNNYRLVVAINYPARIVYIKFFGTHAEYDKIDVAKVHL